MPKKKTTSADHCEQIDSYIRDTCAELDGPIDRAALDLVCRVGVLSVDDPSDLHGTIDELWDVDAVNEKMSAWLDWYTEQNWPEPYQSMYIELEELEMDRENARVEAAYLLGIAVGRRLGPHALTLRTRAARGGAR